MAFDYTRFKARLGKVLGGLNEVNTYRGTTLFTRVDTIADQYGVANPNPDLIADLFTQQDSAETAMNGWISYLGSFAEQLIGAELDNDRAMSDSTLSARITELARRMRADGQTLVECPCTVTVASVGAPTGDHTFVFARHEYTGRVSDYMVPDVYLILCTADRSQGGTAFAEAFSMEGKPADQLPTDAAYPSGTGFSTTLTAIDPATDFGILTDGTFDAITGSNFTNWTMGTGGVWNTNVFQGVDDPRDGASGKCLRLKGDGATVLKVRQEVEPDATGIYTVHARLKKVNDPGVDWAVSLKLVDGAGADVAGPAAYDNTVTSAACSSIAADWTNAISGTFVIPAVKPASGLFVEVRMHQSGALTTAPANLSEVYVDMVCMHTTEPLYAGGLALNVYSGIVEGVVGDARTATVALASGAIGDYVIRGVDRMLGLASLTPRLPTTTSGAATIANSIIS
jgi:hypothetical protein